MKTEESKIDKPVSKKHEKKLKYFSEIFQEKSKLKPELVIKTGKMSFTKNPIGGSNSNPVNMNTATSSVNKSKIVNNPKRFVKSQMFIESFKNLKKISTKSTVPSYLTNNSHSASIDGFNLISSTKSNSIASSLSNSNAFSNSLKHMNLKSQYSTNNTDISNSSFSQKDLKAKYNSINLSNKQKIPTCNVVISLNTHKNRNKKSAVIYQHQRSFKINSE